MDLQRCSAIGEVPDTDRAVMQRGRWRVHCLTQEPASVRGSRPGQVSREMSADGVRADGPVGNRPVSPCLSKTLTCPDAAQAGPRRLFGGPYV